jgi:hypothetical protein
MLLMKLYRSMPPEVDPDNRLLLSGVSKPGSSALLRRQWLVSPAPIDLFVRLAIGTDATLDPFDEPEGEAPLPLAGWRTLSSQYTMNIGIQQNLSGAGVSRLSMMGTKKASDEKKLTRGIGKSN